MLTFPTTSPQLSSLLYLHPTPWLFHGFKYDLGARDHHIISLVQISLFAWMVSKCPKLHMSCTKPISPKACSMITFHSSLHYKSTLLTGRPKNVVSSHLTSNPSGNPISLKSKINPVSSHFSPFPLPSHHHPRCGHHHL